MSNFDKHFEEFKRVLWKRPEEITLVNLIKKKRLKDIQEIESLIQANSNLFELTSDEFKSYIQTKLKEKMNNIKLRNGLDYWQVSLNEKVFVATRDRDNLIVEGYIRTDGSLFWDKPFLVPSIVKEHCDNYVIENKQTIKEENTTADFNVPIEGIEKDSDRFKRMQVYNPYKSAMENEHIGPKLFKESVSEINVSDLFIISEDFDTKNKNISLIVESNGKKQCLLIPKKPLINFVKENCSIDLYLSKGKFLFENFMDSRPLGFKNDLIKEFIENEVTNIDVNELFVSDVQNDYSNNNVIISYTYGIENRKAIVPDGEFFQFCLDNDENASTYLSDIGNDIGSMFDEDSYFDGQDMTEIAKKYLLTNNIV